MKIRYYPVLIVLGALFACSSQVPKKILSPEKMYSVVRDIMLTEEFVSDFIMKDSLVNLKQKRSELYTQVFTLHHTTRKQFFDSYTYYQQHPNLQKILFDSLSNGLKPVEQKKIQAIMKDTAI